MFRSSQGLSFSKDERVKDNTIVGFCCDMCGQGPWTAQTDLDIHRKNAHKWDILRALKNDAVPMCSICLRVQIDNESLIKHILVTHLCSPPTATMINREIYICDYCKRLFFNKQLLLTHIFHWHTKKTPENATLKLNCPKCWKKIRGKSAWFHLLYHGVLDIETCPICLKTCDTQPLMLEHVKTHSNIFRCDICNYETTRECYFKNHLAKHKVEINDEPKEDVSRFFLPQQLLPSLNNRMNNIFKGIPLANEVRICILCRTLCFSEEEMKNHIYSMHVEKTVEQVKKTHQCFCGEVFFNNVLLKQHIFKLKGNHGVWDGKSPVPDIQDEEAVVFQVYELNDPLEIGMNEIIIAGISNYNPSEENEGSTDQHIRELEMEN